MIRFDCDESSYGVLSDESPSVLVYFHADDLDALECAVRQRHARFACRCGETTCTATLALDAHSITFTRRDVARSYPHDPTTDMRFLQSIAQARQHMARAQVVAAAVAAFDTAWESRPG